MHTIKCHYCQEDFQAKRSDALYCSNTCKARAWDKKTAPKPPNVPSSPLRGVISSNKVAKESTPSQDGLSTQIPNPQYELLKRSLEFIEAQIVNNERQKKQIEANLTIIETDSNWMSKLHIQYPGGISAQTLALPINYLLFIVGIELLFNNRAITLEKNEELKKEVKGKIAVQLGQINRSLSTLAAKKTDITSRLNETTPSLPVPIQPTVNSMSLAPNPVDTTGIFKCPTVDKPVSVDRYPFSKIADGATSRIIPSVSLGQMNFQVLDFKDEWEDFLGQPEVCFSMAIHGLPGQGKSTFALHFAHYLASNFGKVIYITPEEGFSKTLQNKLNLTRAMDPNLDIADLTSFEEIIKEIKPGSFNFIFIDSLNRMHINADQLRELRTKYPTSSLITISQATKDGNLRGSLEIIHDCDIAIEVNNLVAQTTKNRFHATHKEFQVLPNNP
jgi:hypothetical protein